MLRVTRFVHSAIQTRAFAASAVSCANRAIVYGSNGNPASTLFALTFPTLPPPLPNTANIRFLLSPINPADINVIEGVYPSKPVPCDLPGHPRAAQAPLYVGGNEGLAEVIETGEGVTELKTGDWVVMTKAQLGTWTSARNAHVQDLLKVPSDLGEAAAATITVNPPTAYNMLHDYVKLDKGDWIVQNGANSAVGQAVIQIAAARGWQTLNCIRNRDDAQSMKAQLRDLGATQVATYDELSDKGFKERVKSWTGGKSIKLGLNCVGGRVTTSMTRLLGQDAHLVSYGAMSKEPLSLPTSLFIFKNLTCHGFWQSRWYQEKSLQERKQLTEALFGLMREGKLRSPEHEVLVIEGAETDEQARDKISEMMETLTRGMYGKKVLLRIEERP
ncbi:hypothetical protein V8B97DRAFT_1993247 [Scleroderma yunnanense]